MAAHAPSDLQGQWAELLIIVRKCLRWRCNGQTDDERFKRFDCNWVGNWLRPGGMQPRHARDITHMNRDEYVDSVELAQVRA
jgi:hypothetical protein